MSKTETSPEQKKVINLYSALGASLLLSFVPSVSVALVSGFLFVGVLVSAYVMRAQDQEGSLIDNHTTFIIRTLWISSFLGMITVGLGSAYLLANHDPGSLDLCAQDFISSGQSINVDTIALEFESCIESYWGANKAVLMMSMLLSAGPLLLYFLIRYARGLSRALRGYRVSNPRGWL